MLLNWWIDRSSCSHNPRLDWCNSLLFGLLRELTSNCKYYDCCSYKTQNWDVWLHYFCLVWITLPANVTLVSIKIPLLGSKVVHILDPIYLCKRLALKLKGGLRSDNTLVLNVPLIKLKLKTHGDRFFSIGGSVLWNELPDSIRLSDRYIYA